MLENILKFHDYDGPSINTRTQIFSNNEKNIELEIPIPDYLDINNLNGICLVQGSHNNFDVKHAFFDSRNQSVNKIHQENSALKRENDYLKNRIKYYKSLSLL